MPGPFSKEASASPTTAPRQWPICMGPVGLAETYSTLTVVPAPTPERHNHRPASRSAPVRPAMPHPTGAG
jgi:hypothetical protein